MKRLSLPCLVVLITLVACNDSPTGPSAFPGSITDPGGDQINKMIIAPLANANKLSDFPDFNDAAKLGSGKETRSANPNAPRRTASSPCSATSCITTTSTTGPTATTTAT